MAYLNDSLFDLPLQYLEDHGSRLDICSTEPATYTQATSTYTLGNKTSITYTGPRDGTVSGRRTTIDAITNGSVTANGTAAFWSIVKPTATTSLLATGALSAGQVVAIGNVFTLTAFDITFPDAA